ncbi:hypothetical protein [Thauera sp.]|jgi:hypothetical protein|nr:hypothetical protein [Thauera sp.]MDX9885282.1 hypothetical protein [Thauera sp.]
MGSLTENLDFPLALLIIRVLGCTTIDAPTGHESTSSLDGKQ